MKLKYKTNNKPSAMPPTYFFILIGLSIGLHFVFPIKKVIFPPYTYLGFLFIAFCTSSSGVILLRMALRISPSVKIPKRWFSSSTIRVMLFLCWSIFLMLSPKEVPFRTVTSLKSDTILFMALALMQCYHTSSFSVFVHLMQYSVSKVFKYFCGYAPTNNLVGHIIEHQCSCSDNSVPSN